MSSVRLDWSIVILRTLSVCLSNRLASFQHFETENRGLSSMPLDQVRMPKDLVFFCNLVQLTGETNIGSSELPFDIHMAGILALNWAQSLLAECLQKIMPA